MHLGVVVPENRCTFEFPLRDGGSCLEEFRFGKIDALRGSSSKIDGNWGLWFGKSNALSRLESFDFLCFCRWRPFMFMYFRAELQQRNQRTLRARAL